MPAVTEYLRPDLIAQVQRLDLRARFIVEGFYAGLHASPYHGFSVEFSEHRKYVPGDDLRTIDWSVYGKTDRFYVKKYRAETNLSAYLIMDLSSSMDFPAAGQMEPGGTSRMTKLDYSICLAAALGHMMIYQQDSIGLALIAERLRTFVPARSKRTHLMRVLGELAAARPAGAARLAEGLHDLASRVPKRGLMILFSDLLCEPGPLIQAFHRLRHAGHDLIVFCVLDRMEADFPFIGPTRFEDPEGGEPLSTDAAAMKSGYLEELRRFIDQYRTALASMHADFAMIHNAMSFDAALTRFLQDRQARF